MKLGQINLVLCFVILVFLDTVLAQTPNYVGHIGSEDGLVSQLCQHLIEDDLGNLWISSFQDIQKYNGHSITVFPAEKTTGDIDGIIDLYKDMNGNIWVSEGKQGSREFDKFIRFKSSFNLYVIDPITNEIIDFPEYVDFSKFGEEDILYVSSVNGIIYLITKDKSVYRYTDRLEFFSTLKDVDSYLTIDTAGNFIYLENNNLNTYDKNDQLVSTLDAPILSHNEAYVVSDFGQLFLLQKQNGGVKISEIVDGNIIALKELSSEHFIWEDLKYNHIKSYEDGSLQLNDLFFYKNDTTNLILKSSHKDNSIYEYLISQSGLSYVATNLGVYVLENKKSLFSQFANSEIQGVNSVRGIFINDKIKAYRNSDGKEIIESNSDNLELKFLENKNLGKLASMHYPDPSNKNHLWSVGYIKGDVRRIDFESKTIDEFSFEPHPVTVNTIHKSSATDKVYIGSYKGMYKLDVSKKLFNKVSFGSYSNSDLDVNDIVEYNRQLLLATSSGIISYSEEEESYKVIPVSVDSTEYQIQYIHKDNTSEEILWLAAKRGGIIKWNTSDNTLRVMNTEDGLSNNDVHVILEDSRERLWVSTNKYLNCLNKKTENISVFTEQDGLTHSEFNRFSYFYDSIQNHMYFGGLNGYTYFNPDSINTGKNENKIKLRLIDGSKTNEDAEVENIYVETQGSNSIKFYDDDVSLQLYLATNHLSNTKQRTYSYRIPKLQDEWITQNTNELKLNRLPYGEYKIEIMADINRPAFTSDILTLDINVIQPFKKTWLGRLLTLLAMFLIIWALVRKYYHNLRDRNLKLEQIVEDRTKEISESNRTKNKLFAILAHDLRNPISSLSGITEKIKFLASNNRVSELEILAEQTKGKISALDDNLNNILIWAMAENKMITLKPEKLSLKLEIKKILDLYSSQLADKKIKVSSDLELLDQVYVDITVLQTILRNLVTNAIKFSYSHSAVKIQKSSESDSHINLSVIDEGIGFDKEKGDANSKIIVGIKNRAKGSGIGLQLVKDLSELSDIPLSFTVNPKGGTIVTVHLPKS